MHSNASWTCAECTFINRSADLLACEVCDCPAPAQLAPNRSRQLSSLGNWGRQASCIVINLLSVDWEQLPAETTSIVFRHCCSSGAFPIWAALTGTCHSWRERTLASPDLYHHIDLSYGWCSPDDRKLSTLRFPEAVRRLNLSSCTKLERCNNLKRFPGVCQLDISYITKFGAEDMCDVLQHASKLTVLVLEACSFKGGKGMVSVLEAINAHRHDTLQKLSLASCPGEPHSHTWDYAACTVLHTILMVLYTS